MCPISLFIRPSVPIQEPSEKSDVVVKVENEAQPPCSVEHRGFPGGLSDGEISSVTITRYLFGMKCIHLVYLMSIICFFMTVDNVSLRLLLPERDMLKFPTE